MMIPSRNVCLSVHKIAYLMKKYGSPGHLELVNRLVPASAKISKMFAQLKAQCMMNQPLPAEPSKKRTARLVSNSGM